MHLNIDNNFHRCLQLFPVNNWTKSDSFAYLFHRKSTLPRCAGTRSIRPISPAENCFLHQGNGCLSCDAPAEFSCHLKFTCLHKHSALSRTETTCCSAPSNIQSSFSFSVYQSYSGARQHLLWVNPHRTEEIKFNCEPNKACVALCFTWD